MAVVLVTGAAGALGSALVAHHVAAGATVVAADRVAVDSLATMPPPGPGQVLPVAGDLTDDDHLADLVDAVTSVGPGLDLLVHSAGITQRSPASTTDMAVFDAVMTVNWRAPVVLTRLAHPQLVAAGGTVVVLGSMAGWMPVLGRSGYGASKAAVSQFMEVWRHELVDDGIDLVMVYPSFLESVMDDTSAGAGPRSEVGTPMPIPDIVARITAAVDNGDRWVFPDRLARLSSLLYRVAPGTYHRLMRQRFSQEL